MDIYLYVIVISLMPYQLMLFFGFYHRRSCGRVSLKVKKTI